MIVKELKQALEAYPDNMEVRIQDTNLENWSYPISDEIITGNNLKKKEVVVLKPIPF